MKNETRMTSEAKATSFTRHSFFILASSLVIAGIGCFPKPNKANIALRREIQSMHDRVAELEALHKSDRAQLAALTANRTVQSLPEEKMARLFTTSSIKFKNLTLGQDLDASKPGDEAFKIAIAPIDQFGDEIKIAGSIKVELFDLAAKETRLGEWTIETPEAQKRWLSTPVIDGYVLTFPWQTVPQSATLLVKATFTEELTGGVFTAQSELKIDPPKSQEVRNSP